MSAKQTWKIVGLDTADPAANALPVELQSIADQLTDEAVRLAVRYPSGSPAIRRAHGIPTWIRVAAAVLIVGVGLAAVSITWQAVRSSESAATNAAGFAAAEQSHGQRMPIAMAEQPIAANVRELSFGAATPANSIKSEAEMLRIQVSAFEQVIRKLQDELMRREKSAAETQELVESLRREIDRLRSQSQKREPPTSSP